MSKGTDTLMVISQCKITQQGQLTTQSCRHQHGGKPKNLSVKEKKKASKKANNRYNSPTNVKICRTSHVI